MDFIFLGEVGKYNFTCTEYYSDNYPCSVNHYHLSIRSEVSLLESKSLHCFFLFFAGGASLPTCVLFIKLLWNLAFVETGSQRKEKNLLIKTTYCLIPTFEHAANNTQSYLETNIKMKREIDLYVGCCNATDTILASPPHFLLLYIL